MAKRRAASTNANKEAVEDGPQRASVYIRVSTTNQSEQGYSLPAHRDDARAYADERGLGLTLPDDCIFADTGSGSDWELPRFCAMMAAAEGKRFTVLVVTADDRLSGRMEKPCTLNVS